ncbi:MAG: hypothetical protein AAF975_05095, partial [Spirochaetota bacterium]
SQSMGRLWGIMRYTWLHWYSAIRQKLLAYQVGREHYQQGNELDFSRKLYDASAPDSLVRKRFFRQLKTENLALIPRSKGVLLLEEGTLEGSVQKLEESLRLLDAKWDAGDREKAYIELSRLRQQSGRRYQDLLNAYRSNRAALKLKGIPLPLEVQISGSAAYRPEQRAIKRKLQAYLRRSGAEIVNDPGMPVLRLQIQWSDEKIKAYLLSEKGIVLEGVDTGVLEKLMSLGASGEGRVILKQFAQNFMRLTLTPNR